MKHDWKPHPDAGRISRFGLETRHCQNCGAEQSWEPQGEWLRIGRYKWVPLVGRCKKNEKDRK